MKAKRTPKGEPEQPAAKPGGAEELGLISGANVKKERLAWAWPGMIVRNALNLIDAHKGSGKSSVMATVAATICGGKKLPEAKTAGPKGSCLWFGSEEHFGGAVVSRWVANGGNPNGIFAVANSGTEGVGPLVLPDQEERLREMVKATSARVIVADPYTALAGATFDTRHEQSTRLYLESLARVAHDLGVTVLLSRHLRKGRSGSLLEHGLGSVAIAAVCRSVLRVERSKEDPATCYLGCVAGNHGRANGVVPFSLVEKEGSVFCAVFRKRQDAELSEVLEGDEEPDERDALGDARRLLLASLKDGPVDAKTLLSEARNASIGERTLRKAKSELGVKATRVSAGRGVAACWKWSLPKS